MTTLKKPHIQFLLVFLTASIILFPRLTFQPLLAQGDHGRDLYCFEAAGRGDVPYRDFFWPYGPLMLYYYAFFFKLFGTSIATVLLGLAVLNLTAAIIIYLILSCFAPFLIAFVGAMWFLTFNPGFFHTYNHYGGVTLELLLVYMLVLYRSSPRIKYLWIGSLCVLALMFIKLNFGLAGWIAFHLALLLINKVNGFSLGKPGKRLYLWTALGIPLCVAAVHYLLLRGLPSYQVQQCFPYFSRDQFPHTSIVTNIYAWIKTIFSRGSFGDFTIAVIFVVCGIKASTALIKKRFDTGFYREMISVMLTFVIFYFMSLNEFLLTGVQYRTSWADPIVFLLIFGVVGFCFRYHKRSELIALSLPLCIVIAGYFQVSLVYISELKMPYQYFEMKKGGIMVQHSIQWFTTVRATTAFLKEHLKGGEKFLAIPYDPLYYFLMDTVSPTPVLMFYKLQEIPLEQEKSVIADLESEHVNYILASSQIDASNPMLGVFGEDHCRLLYKYIKDNFEVVAIYGNWRDEPDWVGHHGTIILKRRGLHS